MLKTFSDDEGPPLLLERITGAGGSKGGSSDTEGGEEAPNTLKSKQTARVIDLLSEGPIQGVVGGAKGVYYDGVVVRRADNSYNFKSATIQFVNGYPAQGIMSGFASAEAEESVGLQLKVGFPLVRSIGNIDFDRARVTVSVPSLQRVEKKTGNIYGSEVSFRIETNTNNGGWKTLGDYTISGKTTSVYQRAYVFTLPRPGPWDIRLTRLTPDSTTLDLQNDLFWDSYTQILDDKVNYTNSALVGTIIDAEQFRSIPKRTFDVEGLLIRYPDNLDTSNYTYTGDWKGVFKFGFCNNPAWVLYDLIINNRYGIGDYIPASMVDPYSFYKAGVFCDQRVKGKGGVLERRFQCNIRITDRQEAFDLLEQMASIFRGFTYWNGGKLVLVADQPSTPTDIFTNANVIDGIFTYSGTELRTRHTQVLVAWQDPKQLGETRVVSVEDAPAISRYGLQQAQETAYGCTGEAQALRQGKWTLYSEQYEDESIVFKTGLHGSYLKPGDIFQVMDANIAGKRRGGRTGEGSTYTTVVFDAPVNLVAGRTYQVNCVIVTDEDTSTVQSRPFVAETTGPVSSVDLSSGFSKPPKAGQPFVITESTLNATLWRAITNRQTQSDQHEVNGVRHFPQKWDYVEKNLAFSEPDITDINAKPPAVTNLKVIEYIAQTSAISLQVMATLSWTSQAPLFDVYYHRLTENWTHIRTDQKAINLPVTAETYEFQVTPIGTIGLKGPTSPILRKTFVGLSAPPAAPTNLRVKVVEGIAMFDWDPATEIDVRIGGHFELRFSPATSGAAWNTAQTVVPQIPGTATTVEANYQSGTWMLRTYDIDGRPSPEWATIIALAADLRYVQFFTFCENSDWLGTHNGTEIKEPQDWLVIGATGGLWDGQLDNMSTWADVDVLPLPPGVTRVEGEGVYTFFRMLDVGAPFSIRIAADILAFPFYSVAGTVDERAGDVDTWISWDDAGTDLDGSVTILIRSTLDNPGDPGAVWTSWQRFITGEHYGRAFQFQALLQAPPGQNIGVEQLCITADFRSKIDAGENVSYSAVETRVFYRIKFYTVPAVVVTIRLAMAEDRVEIVNKTREYFDLKITQTVAGTNPVGARNFDWHAQGY